MMMVMMMQLVQTQITAAAVRLATSWMRYSITSRMRSAITSEKSTTTRISTMALSSVITVLLLRVEVVRLEHVQEVATAAEGWSNGCT